MADEQERIDDSTLDDSILGTAKIDPAQYNALEGKISRFSSLKYAIAGLIYMFRRENSIKVLVLLTLGVFGLLLWLPVEPLALLLVVHSLGLIWMAETINSAVEAVVDLTTDEIHPLAKVAKDVSSSAVLIGGIVLVVTVVVVFGPPLLENV